MSSTKAYTKEDLKKLMQLKKVSSTKRIDSPLARYDNAGVLSCVVCPGVKIKQESFWSSHLVSKHHKEVSVKKM